MTRKASETLAERNIPGPDDLDAAVGKAEAEGAVGVEAVEATGEAVAGAVVDGQRGARRVGAGEPGLGKGAGGSAAPHGEDPRHAGGEEGREGVGGQGRVGGERGGQAALDRGGGGEVDAEARDDAVGGALEQDAGELRAAEEQVIGPFERERRAGRGERRPPR